MDSNGAVERLLIVGGDDAINQAAVLLLFGAQLRTHMPLDWFEIFPSKQAYFAYVQHRGNESEIVIRFNFKPDGVDAKAVFAAYETKGAEDTLREALRSVGLDSGAVARLLELHSRALVQAAREALEWREWLVKERIKTFPERAKMVEVTGEKKGTFARFSKFATKETRMELLNKI
jgi:hypothetical protein